MGDVCKNLPVSVNDVKEAYKRIEKYVRKTPLIKSFSLSANHESDVYLKLENVQLTGSFKVRGALNKIATLTDEEKVKGVYTCSAGNHSQGVALGSKLFGVPATIAMPESADPTKVAATEGYGAKVLLHGDSFNESKKFILEYCEKEGVEFLDPCDKQIVAGHGTVGVEIIQDMWDVDTVIAPIGGGGLISGLAVSLKSFNPDIKIIGVQSENIHGMKASFDAGVLTGHAVGKTIADGAAVEVPGKVTFEIVKELVDDIVTVSEDQIFEGMKFLIQRGKQIPEGSGALPIAALQNNKIPAEFVKGKKVICIVSGGNIHPDRVAEIINSEK